MSRQPGGRSWWRRARHSLRVRLVMLFVLLAAALGMVFLYGVGHALSLGWRETVNPLFDDYADRLVAEIGSPPSVDKAERITQRLPLVIRIDGPQVQWASGQRVRRGPPWLREGRSERGTIVRHSADGHRIEFSTTRDPRQGESAPIVWGTLAGLLALIALAYGLISRLLRPIGDIGAGAQRFGAGRFEPPIPVRHARHPDELSELAQTVNQMAADIQQMLDAKRGLLLAVSHELRSPLTRARLNAELLPEGGEAEPARAALLRDLALMRELITDLLESERLASPHAALQRETTDLPALARELIGQLAQARPEAAATVLQVATDFPPQLPLDAARIRLALRNLLDNAWRHSPAGAPPPAVTLARGAADTIVIEVRDHGPGVPPEQLTRLAEAFYRPDSARQRSGGGVGLGLYLVRLVAQAHGGRFAVHNAQPGLLVRLDLPAVNAID